MDILSILKQYNKEENKNNNGKIYDYSVIVQGNMIELWTDLENMAKFLSKIPGVSYVSRCDGNFYNIFVDKRYVVGRVAEVIAEWLETKLWTPDSHLMGTCRLPMTI